MFPQVFRRGVAPSPWDCQMRGVGSSAGTAPRAPRRGSSPSPCPLSAMLFLLFRCRSNSPDDCLRFRLDVPALLFTPVGAPPSCVEMRGSGEGGGARPRVPQGLGESGRWAAGASLLGCFPRKGARIMQPKGGGNAPLAGRGSGPCPRGGRVPAPQHPPCGLTAWAKRSEQQDRVSSD